MFDIFDKHKEGQIPSTDLGVVLRVLNLNPTESELEEMINEVDPTKSQFIDLNAVYLLYERKQKDTDTLEELVEALHAAAGRRFVEPIQRQGAVDALECVAVEEGEA